MKVMDALNIEGDYEQILEDLEAITNPVNHANSHGLSGVDDEGEFYTLNWGLFSINPGTDGHSERVCHVCHNDGLSLWNVEWPKNEEDEEYQSSTLDHFGLTMRDLDNPIEVVF